MANTLYLLDGMALAYRAHFALIRNPIVNSKGINTSAIFGFTNTILELIQQKKPSHLAIVFDTSAPTERHRIHPEYKANRDAMPEELAVAIPQLDRIAQVLKSQSCDSMATKLTTLLVHSHIRLLRKTLIRFTWSHLTKILVNWSLEKLECIGPVVRVAVLKFGAFRK